MRCRQDSIHSNPNDISSSEGDRSIHLTIAWLDAGCWRIHHRRWYTYYILWRRRGKYIIQQVNERTRFTILYSFKHEWYLVLRGRYLLNHSSLAGWCRHILSHTYICHDRVIVHIQTYHEMLSVSTSLIDPMTDADGISYLDWDREHIHMLTYIPQMLSVYAHIVSKRNIYIRCWA